MTFSGGMNDIDIWDRTYVNFSCLPVKIDNYRESGKLINVEHPSGHKLHLTSGTANMAMWCDCNARTVVEHDHADSHV